MFHVDWSAVVTDSFLNTLRSIAGSGTAPDNASLRPLATSVLRNSGGLPVAAQNWSETQRTAVSQTLHHESVGAALRRAHGMVRPLPGCDFAPVDADDSALPLDREVIERPRINVNSATAADLEALPVLGPALAKRTIEERRTNGSFESASDLANRVSGVGDSGAERLNMMLYFGTPDRGRTAPDVFVHDFETDFKLLLSLHSSSAPAEQLTAALESLAAITGAMPHPATRTGRIRDDLVGDKPRSPARFSSVERAEVLEDGAYYPRVRELLGAAKKRIDVAMFFIAFTNPTHPTGQLLERLTAAHDRGVAVRVLVDRDREDDPYGSRVINAKAIAFLRDRGVSVRTDAEGRLLHSKFVALDEAITIIGSHNWTAGSYFRYRDTSLALLGPERAKELHARFDGMWDEGETP